MRKHLLAAAAVGLTSALIAAPALAQYPGGPQDTAKGPAASGGVDKPKEDVPWISGSQAAAQPKDKASTAQAAGNQAK